MLRKVLPAVLVGAAAALWAVNAAHSLPSGGRGSVSLHSSLPLLSNAKLILNTTQRHREWITATVDSAAVRAFVVYPERADKAPVVLLGQPDAGASDWIRAAADQLAAEGYITVVPDVLSGMGPRGGDSNSFATAAAVAAALRQLGQREIARRWQAIAAAALALPPANGQLATMQVVPSSQGAHIAVRVSGKRASFQQDQAWNNSIAFLNVAMDNHPVGGVNPNVPEDHSAHMLHMAMAQAPPAPVAGAAFAGLRGYPITKLPNLPAGLFSAKSTLLHSTLQRKWVDIPVGDIKLHTWVEYPAGSAKAPLVIVMQQAPGLDDWQRGIADQLALQGFIAVAPDLYSGLGPNGGNYDSFDGPDAAIRAFGRLSMPDIMRRYQAAYAWGMALPRASGKSATFGFCAGGGASFQFAGEVPQINAAVVFYGGPPTDAAMAKIKAPVIGFYGEDDARVTAQVLPTAQKMKDLGKLFEYHIYPHATHAFIDFQDMDQNTAATADSWPRAIAFLNSNLR